MWNHEGIKGDPQPPEIYQQCRGSLLILGAGRSLWEDLESVKYHEFDDVMAVNFTAAFYPGYISHFATLEADMASFCFGLRKRIQDKSEYVHVHINEPGHAENAILWGIESGIKAGTSGLFAVTVGVCLGFDKIVLAGMPLNNGGRFFDPPTTDSGMMEYEDGFIRRTWENYRFGGEWAHKVRGCSGRTRGWFGEPTKEWLES
jgi:hypothetical protein